MSDSKSGSVPPVIEMTGVAVPSVRRPNTHSIKNVDWRVAAGDYWVVAGLESTGKSDFLMMTAGLVPPGDGSYRLFGEPMPIFEGERLATRLRLGLVFDDARLFNHLTVADNVGLPLQYHRDMSDEEASHAVLDILKWMELLPWANSMPGAMGRSWQKRAALARAITLRPEVLLLDDPLIGLDARHASWWLGFLDQLSGGCDYTEQRPVTLVVTTGALESWMGKGRQFASLKHGEFTVLGTREKLTEPVGATVGEFLPGTTGN